MSRGGARAKWKHLGSPEKTSRKEAKRLNKAGQKASRKDSGTIGW